MYVQAGKECTNESEWLQHPTVRLVGSSGTAETIDEHTHRADRKHAMLLYSPVLLSRPTHTGRIAVHAARRALRASSATLAFPMRHLSRPARPTYYCTLAVRRTSPRACSSTAIAPQPILARVCLRSREAAEGKFRVPKM